MSNRIILVISILLGISVIAICIYKSTTLHENYNFSVNHEDVINPCTKKELKGHKKYKINKIIKILKRYNLESTDIKTISDKLNEKGEKGMICHRALKSVISTYLIYYKPILNLLLTELNIKKSSTSNEDLAKQLDDEDLAKQLDDENLTEQLDDEEVKEIDGISGNDDYMEYEEDKNKNISFGTMKKMLGLLKSDGLITDYNEDSMLRFYSNRSF